MEFANWSTQPVQTHLRVNFLIRTPYEYIYTGLKISCMLNLG